jgi:hypothetical protein
VCRACLLLRLISLSFIVFVRDSGIALSPAGIRLPFPVVLVRNTGVTRITIADDAIVAAARCRVIVIFVISLSRSARKTIGRVDSLDVIHFNPPVQCSSPGYLSGGDSRPRFSSKEISATRSTRPTGEVPPQPLE